MSVASPETRSDARRYRRLLGGMLLAGLAIRLLLVPDGVFGGDFGTFGSWAVQLVRAPLSVFYASGGRPADHLPGDLWLLWGIAQICHVISPGMAVGQLGFLYLVKLVPSLADVGIGLLFYLIACQLAGLRVGLIAAALYLFNPAPILVSGLVGPVLASAAVFFAVDLPFNVELPLLPTRWTIFDRLSVALDSYTSVTLNADNLWQLITPSQGFGGISDYATFLAGLSYQTWGMLLLGATVLIALGLFWCRPTRTQLIWSALAITFALFMLPTSRPSWQ